VIEQLTRWGAQPPHEVVGRAEHVLFALPRELRRKSEEPV
jgi:hypothetical protein